MSTLCFLGLRIPLSLILLSLYPIIKTKIKDGGRYMVMAIPHAFFAIYSICDIYVYVPIGCLCLGDISKRI